MGPTRFETKCAELLVFYKVGHLFGPKSLKPKCAEFGTSRVLRRCQNFNLVVGGGLLFETALYDIPLCPSYIIPRPIFSVITFFHFLHFSMALSINSFFFLCVYLLFRTSRPSLYGRIYLCSALILSPLSFYLRKSSFLESGFFL